MKQPTKPMDARTAAVVARAMARVSAPPAALQEPDGSTTRDIDILFRTVQAHLALLTEGRAPAMRTAAVECAADLKRLRAVMDHQLALRRQLEQSVQALHRSLAEVKRTLRSTVVSERNALDRALHDALTQLPNAPHLRARIDSALKAPEALRRPVAVLFIDLDGFKQVNDTHGHDAGDAVLRVVASRLLGCVRAEDVVSRLGGDEFACLLSGVPNRAQLSRLAREMMNAVASPLKIGALSLSVRLSIGIAIAPEDGVTSPALMKRADAAMYGAKRNQSGYAFFDPDAHEQDVNGHSSVFDRLTETGDRRACERP